MFKSHESQRCTDRFGRWVLPLLATLHKQLTQTVAIIGTWRFQLKYRPFMLTNSSLTRDNYQQTRLFVWQYFCLQFCVFLAFQGNIFHKQNKHFGLYRLFPSYFRKRRSKKNKQFLYTELTSHFWKCKLILCCQLVFELSPSRPDSYSHFSPSGG